MRAHDEAGLTLVDVLVGLVLMAFIALGLMTMATLSLHLGKAGQERTAATALATERIDELASLPYRPASDYQAYRRPEETASAGPPPTLVADYGAIPDYSEYKRVVVLNYGTPSAGMLTTEVTVYWKHAGQGEKGHTMVTFLHPGLR